MTTTSPTPEPGGLISKDLATILAPKEGRGPIVNKDLKTWQKNMTKHLEEKGGEDVFKANMVENEDDLLVNFEQMRRILGDEEKRVAAMPATDASEKAKQVEAQAHLDRLALRCNVYDKLLNGKGSAELNTAELQDTMTVMGKLPGFCESVVLALDSKITLEQTKQMMMGTKFVSLDADQRKIVGAMIADTADDETFHNMLSKSLSKLELDANDATLSQTIISLRENIKDEAKRKQEVADADVAMSSYTQQTSEVRNRIDSHGAKIETALSKLEDKFKPLDYTQSGFKAKADDLKLKRDSAKKDFDDFAKGVKPDPTTLERLRQSFETFMYQYDAAFALEGLFTQANGESDYKEFIKVRDAKAKKQTAEDALKSIETTKREIATKESERSKYADKYKRKMEVALSESMKRNWNENLLKKAQVAAEARRAAAAEVESKEKEAQKTREDIAGKIVEKFIYASYLKYRNGKTVGWEDRDLKQFVKKDMFANSPAHLAQEMFRRINSSRSNMPDSYSKELKGMYEEMGLGKGNPPMTMTDVMNKIKPEKWEEIAQKVVPDVLGYAYGRKYYFDRQRINPAQAEFMRQMYGDDFFTKALEAKGKYADIAAKMVEDGILTEGAISKAKMRELMGSDWVEGTKRLAKTAAVAGAIGAGTFIVTGGLGATIASLRAGVALDSSLTAGALTSATTLEKLGMAGVKTAQAASQIAGGILQGAGNLGQNVAQSVIDNPWIQTQTDPNLANTLNKLQNLGSPVPGPVPGDIKINPVVPGPVPGDIRIT